MYYKKHSSTRPSKLGQTGLDSVAIQLFCKLDQADQLWKSTSRTWRQEARSLEFWRAIIAECLASFFYVFLVCAAQLTWPGNPLAHQPSWLLIGVASGLSMATLGQCFGHISGAHVNPALTIAMLITRRISLLRTVFYLLAQCGGAIAGAALLYGVSVPGHQGALGVVVAHEMLSAWQVFGVEFVLTFLIVFTVFATVDPNRRCFGSDSLAVGIAYLACTISGLPSSGASLNPARALGPAFVMNRWKHHWVFWSAPISGGILAALIYEFIFDTKRMSRSVREILEQVDKELQCKEHLEDGSKCPLSYASQHSSSASSNASSSGPQSNLTGYSSVASAAFHPAGNASFPSSVITGDQLYASNSTPAGPSFQLTNAYTAALYGTNSRNAQNHQMNMRTIAYGANLASSKY